MTIDAHKQRMDVDLDPKEVDKAMGLVNQVYGGGDGSIFPQQGKGGASLSPSEHVFACASIHIANSPGGEIFKCASMRPKEDNPESRISLCAAIIPERNAAERGLSMLADCHKPGPLSPIGDGGKFSSNKEMGGVIGGKREFMEEQPRRRVINPVGVMEEQRRLREIGLKST